MTVPHILLIDNDFESKKKAVISLYSNDLEVIAVSNIKEGTTALRNFKFDLIICDMHLADGDADHVIQTVKTSRKFAHIPVIVISSRANEGEKVHVLKMGAAAHLLKTDAHFVSTVKETLALHKHDYEETSMGISGQLAKMKIVDLIAHLAAEEGSGVITIDGDIVMEIHLSDGNIVHARHGITVGKKALFRCLRIAEAAFHFVPEKSNSEPSIEMQLEALLEEARQSNERLMANYHKLPHANFRVRVLHNETQSLVNLKPEARAALEIFKKYPRIGSYLDRLNLPDILCYEYLVSLLDKGYVELVTERKPVKIITDCGSDLPSEWIREGNITVLPIQLRIGNDVFPANFSTDEKKIYSKKPKHLEAGEMILPDEAAVKETYISMLPGFDCLSIFSGSPGVYENMSSTINEVRDAGLHGKSLLANELTTLNSHGMSVGLGLLARFAGILAAKGDQIESIEDKVMQCIASMHIIFAVEPERSFHVKKGNAPVFLSWDRDAFHETKRLNKGEVIAPALIREVEKRIDRKSNLHIVLGHVRAKDKAEQIAQEMSKQLSLNKVPILPIGPMTGFQLGDGAVGVAFFQE